MVNVGIDVGSTTVKCVVLDGDAKILFSDYRRHEARQMEMVVDYLKHVEKNFGDGFNLFVTGSGGSDIARLLGVKFVQEINAVSLAVETLHRDVKSVIELGGQDAKMIFFSEVAGRKRKFSTMNDKCAGGTGATIDRILRKLNISCERAMSVRYDPSRVHPVAAKCGVFAETDINSLQKSGVPEDELLISLFDAIVLQNLNVLTRGNIIEPLVLLLGGPNTFFPCLVDCWKFHLKKLWMERSISFSEGDVVLPSNSQLYAAIGSAMFGFHEESVYKGYEGLRFYILKGKEEVKRKTGEEGLLKPGEDLEFFRRQYSSFTPPIRKVVDGDVVDVFLGIDAGSTSTKAVVIDEDFKVVASAYTLSSGNPIRDAKKVLGLINDEVLTKGISLNVLSSGITGYAKDMLKGVLGIDVAIVETVAHTLSAKVFFEDVDVIVDVGGQDIKVMVMSDGKVRDFKLNTQCSAGNGYYLQSTAERFGYRVEEYADVAFSAKYVPKFSFGCAVFLEQDVVDFQRMGWEPPEILAGLAKVLPKNVWLYVVMEPNLRKLGRRFLLQGGTQKNLAAVKAQYDFIKSKVDDAEIFVHPLPGEAGAFGAAVEAARRYSGKRTSFLGFEAIAALKFSVRNDDSTRCSYCANRCRRVFIDAVWKDGSKRYIVAPCERGMAETLDALKGINMSVRRIMFENPNLQEVSVKEAFKECKFGDRLVIGIPRVLNLYSLAPFFTGYFEYVGADVVFSDVLSEGKLRNELVGGAIDPCYPSKLALAHISNLLKKSLDVIFFPKVVSLPPFLKDSEGSLTCPTASGTPMSVRSVLTTDGDIFKRLGVLYLSPVLHFDDLKVLEYELLSAFSQMLGITEYMNRHAIKHGFEKYYEFLNKMRKLGRAILYDVENGGRMAILVLCRPYHNDPSVNHGITGELQKRGYPILVIESLPVDKDILLKVFGNEPPFSIKRVWKKSYNENTNRKIWAALYASGHPNIAVVDLSSFRCGLDAPIYGLIEKIMERSKTPYFTFHEIDENKSAGSIKIRVETIDYFLKEYMNSGLVRKSA